MDPEERECERLLQTGDPEALPRLFRRFQRPLLSFLYHQTGDRAAAEDLLQEAFVRVWRNRESYEPRGRLCGWLFTIARRLAIDFGEKRRARGGESLPEELPDPRGGPERAAEALISRERIDAAIAGLPESQREVFLLREYGGLSFAEIAELSGCPLSTALARMRYALLKLRKELGDLDA